MKNLFLLLAVMALVQSCSKDDCTQDVTYVQYTPIYAEKADVRALVEVKGPASLEAPSKIYAYEDYLFISDLNAGVHVINNANPKNPIPEAFINAPGARDMAIRGDYLYIDHYTDLIVIDIAQPAQPRVLNTVEDVFMEYNIDRGEQVVTGYAEETVMRTTACDDLTPWFFDDRNVDVLLVADNASFAESSTGRNMAAATGTGGSFARFVIADGNLYTVGLSTLRAINLSNPVVPVMLTESEIGWDIETIFASGENLFVGSQSGMIVYSIADPQNPTFVSQFQHAQACDPVYVNNKTAYVTLRDGNDCGESVNELLVIDVEDIRNPILLEAYEMIHPHGLTVSDDELILAQGDSGIFIYDLKNRSKIEKRYVDDSLHAYDVIRLGVDHVLVIGDDGLYQYEIKEDQPQLLSVLSAF